MELADLKFDPELFQRDAGIAAAKKALDEHKAILMFVYSKDDDKRCDMLTNMAVEEILITLGNFMFSHPIIKERFIELLEELKDEDFSFLTKH